jgi:chromosome segregation ATPase
VTALESRKQDMLQDLDNTKSLLDKATKSVSEAEDQIKKLEESEKELKQKLEAVHTEMN